MKTIVLIGGLPGSGKTTLGKALVDYCGDIACLVDPDETRLEVALFLQEFFEMRPDLRLERVQKFYSEDVLHSISKRYSNLFLNDDWKQDDYDHPWFYHRDVTQMTIDLMIEKARLFKGNMVVVPSAFVMHQSRRRFEDFADANHYKLHRFWLDLDDEGVLVERIQSRLEKFQGTGPLPPCRQSLIKAQSVFEPTGLDEWVHLNSLASVSDNLGSIKDRYLSKPPMHPPPTV